MTVKAIHIMPKKDKWEVRLVEEGRVHSLERTQYEAIEFARKISSGKEGVEITLHNKNGYSFVLEREEDLRDG